MSKLKLWSSFITLMLCLTGSAIGQERSGGMEGTVSDSTGARVAGATITITSLSSAGSTAGGAVSTPTSTTGFTRTTTTDGQGFFRALEIPPGFYVVSVNAANFRPVRQEGVEVALGRNTPVNFAVEAGGVSEEVVVQASDAAAIDATDSKIQTNISDRTIELTPKGTNFTSVLQVSPATRNEPLNGGFQIDGASGSENTFIIDGQEVTNFRTGTLNANNNIPFEFVQEIQVKSNGFEAEFGGATGGVINVVTKGGSNDYRGEIGTQFELSKLSGRTRAVQGANQQVLTYFQFPRDSFTRTFPTATLSGPIIKDRLWFLASYNAQFLPLRRSYVYQDGTSVSYQSNDRRDYGFVRLDASPTNKLQLSGTFNYSPLRRHGILPTFNTIANALTASRAVNPVLQRQRGGRQPASNVTFSAVYTPTSNLVLSLRGGRGYLNEKLDNYAVPSSIRILCQGTGNLALPGVTSDGRCASGFQNITGNSRIERDISIRQTLDADVNYLTNFLGRHQIKGGYQLNRLSNDVQSGNVGIGTVVLNFGQAFADADGIPRGRGTGEFGYGFAQQFGETGIVSSKNEGLYIQDTYQPINRLSLNLGVRIERENVPPFNDGPGVSFGFGDKVAPRLGVAYDVLGNSRLKLFASYGQFYDRFKYELPRGSFGGNIFTNDYFTITNPNFNAASLQDALTRSFLQLNFRVPANTPKTDPEFVAVFGNLPNLIDPDLKPIKQTEFTFGTEYEVARNLVLGARYTRKDLDRTIEDVGVPDSGGNETFFIANPGEGIVGRSLISGVPPTPKVQRQYDAFEVRLDKRFSRNYYINSSYTYSRLYGNYGGLASADEAGFASIALSDVQNAGLLGRTAPNVTRAFDLPFESFNPNGEPNNGRLSTDRPHAFKFFGGYEFKWFGRSNNSTDFYTSFTALSGTPLTTTVDILDVVVVATQRGDLGRTEKFTQTDFGLNHRYRFGDDGRFTLVIEANVLNLFNEANELSRYTLLSSAIFDQSALTGRDDASRTEGIRAIFNGGTTSQINALLGTPGFERDARFNNPNFFQAPRQVRFGFRLQF